MKDSNWLRTVAAVTGIVCVLLALACKPGVPGFAAEAQDTDSTAPKKDSDSNVILPTALTLDTALYDARTHWMVNGDSSGKWPVKAEYPKAGAILPIKRILAFYGNLYSKRMGILGELPEAQMLKKLQEEVKRWQAADTTVQVIPALHYIAVTAQGSAGADGKYRLRMPFKEIDKVLAMAKKLDSTSDVPVFVDIQVGLSTLQAEVPQLEKYLKMPNVHLGIDPEFSMKTGKKPGSVIGSFDAADINYVTGYLAKLVKENDLPPKVLVVHRFTQGMVTNTKNIKLNPEVQIVMDMDGWGAQARKITTYRTFIHREPVQFTGFKLFYKNDFREPNSSIMTPEQVLKLKPQPVYIQYQ